MTKDEIETVRAIVRMEIHTGLKQHLSAMVTGCIAPLSEAIATVIENQRLQSQGQVLIERSLLERPDDNEPWRQSLDDES